MIIIDMHPHRGYLKRKDTDAWGHGALVRDQYCWPNHELAII